MILAKRPPTLWALLAGGLQIGAPVLGQDADTGGGSSVECISLTRVTRTEVVDEQTILFHLRGQETLSNYLPRECPGLDDKTAFTYETTTNRLCNNDTITLIEKGAQLRPGITCRLGRFVPAATRGIVDPTLDGNASRTRDNLIEIRRIDLPPAGDADAATGPPAPPPGAPPTTTDGTDE